MNKYLFISFSILFLFFSFYKSVFASTLIQQSVSDTETANNTDLGQTINGGMTTWGQMLGTGLSGTVATTSVYLRADPGLGNMTVEITIECYDASNYESTSTSFNAGCSQSPVGTASTSPILVNGETLYNFSTPLTLNPTKYYKLGIGCSNGCSGGTNPNLRTLGSATNLYPNGDFKCNARNSCLASTTAITDLYFTLTGNFSGPNSISIIYPANNLTPIKDFSNWQVAVNGSISKIQINYGGPYSSYSDTETYNLSTNGFINLGVSKKSALASSTYFATPYILNASGTIIATGTTIFFSISGNSTSSGQYGQGSFDIGVNSAINFLGGGMFGSGNNTTSSCAFNAADLNIIGNGIAYGGCIIANILFVPHTDMPSEIKGNILDFTTVFPFSIPFTIIQEINNNTTSTPTQGSLALQIPDINNTTFTVLTSSTMSNIVGTNAKNSVFNGIRTIMYLATGLHIFFVIF